MLIKGRSSVEKPSYKIAVVTVQYGSLPYFEFSTEINQTYCDRHGYEFIVAGRIGLQDIRHPNWSKVRAVAQALAKKEHDYVLFIDADAWFHDQGRTLNQFILEHMSPETLMVFGTDRRDKYFAWSDKDVNAGVFLVRNTPLARQIVDEWWQVADYDEEARQAWPLEQLAFNRHIRPRWQSNGSIKAIAYHHMNGRDGLFIRHAVFEEEHIRLATLKAECERICGGDAREAVTRSFPNLVGQTFLSAGKHGRQECLPHQTATEAVTRSGLLRHCRISLCMIVRNEENNLADCLRPIAHLFDEIVIIDCGSTDRTRTVAASFGARVFDYTWDDSFAAARNEWFRHARYDWIFWLDADDRLDDANVLALEHLFGLLRNEYFAYLMKQVSVEDDTTQIVDQVRLFRRQEGIAWRYRVHEQIAASLLDNGARLIPTDIVINHLGYQTHSILQRKLERNLRLLELEQRERPDEPFVLYNLAKSLLFFDRLEPARIALHRCLELAFHESSYVAKAYVLLAQIYHNRGELDQAFTMCLRGRDAFPDDPELLFEKGLIHHAQKDLKRAQHCFEQILAGPAQPCYSGLAAGIHGHLTRHQLALLARDESRWPEAEVHWKEAVRLLSSFVPAWMGLAEIYLMQRRIGEVEAMVVELQSKPQGVLIAGLVRARFRWSRGDVKQARLQLEKLNRDYPRALWPRLLLLELLVRENIDHIAATALMKEIITLDPSQQAACAALARQFFSSAGSGPAMNTIEAATGPSPNDPQPMPGFPAVRFLKPLVKNPNVIVGEFTYYDEPDINPEPFETKNVLYHYPHVGDKLVIGKFCALARHVRFVMNGANHRLSGFSSYPFQVFGNGWEVAQPVQGDLPYKGDTVVGNDVWFGFEALVMPGVTIGDGAIIGTRAVVTRNVPPYAIAAGNPARVVKQRFPDEVVAELLMIRWWDWPVEKITRNLEAIVGGDLAVLRKAV